MKKGDIVTIRDYSYSREVIKGKLIYPNDAYQNKEYVIVETECRFPIIDCLQGAYNPTFNNTVIQDVDSGKVVFIEERFLRPVSPTHKVMLDVIREHNYTSLCGPIVEISDKLYKEIKRGPQN